MTERSDALTRDQHRALAEAEALWAHSFGTGSQRELRVRWLQALTRLAPGQGSLSSLREQAEQEHQGIHGVRRLAAELREERERDAAVSDDAALVAYERRWSGRLARLQRMFPARWRVPGLSDGELRDELTLRLIDAVRTQPEERAAHLRAGREWGLSFLAHQRQSLRRSFALEVEPFDPSPVLDRGPDEEERLIERQHGDALRLASERAESALSRPQRRWLAAMKLTANAGEFFVSSGRLNLAAASRLLARDRSSAQRAFGELQHLFGRELKKIEG